MGVISVTSANFDETVIQSSKPVLVDFWATWCGPCQMLSPIIESISEERDDIVVAKLNVDEEMEIAGRYGVTGIPMVALFENGDVSKTSLGYQSKEDLLQALGLV